MRRRLLAAVAVTAVLYGTIQPAYAVLGVGDIVFDPTTYAQIEQEAKQGLEELKWLADLYGDAEKTVQQLVNFYNLFAHVTDAAQLAQVLNTQFLKSPMLADALQLEQAFSGMGLHTTLAAKIQATANRLRYYTPSNNDFAGFRMNQQVNATAGQLASAEDAYAAANQRVTGLTELLANIGTDDPKKVLDLTARGTLETATAVAQANQLAAARLIQQAQQDTARQQQDQGYRFSVDQLRTNAQAAVAAAQAGAVNLVTR